MPSIDPTIKKQLTKLYVQNLSFYSRLLYRIGVFEIAIKSAPIGYRIGSRVRFYHPAAWIFSIVIIGLKTIIGIMEGVSEVYDSIVNFNYTATTEPIDKKNKPL